MLRLGVPQFTELLRERLLPRAALLGTENERGRPESGSVVVVAVHSSGMVSAETAVVGDLTPARLSVSTSAETRARFAQALRRAELAAAGAAR